MKYGFVYVWRDRKNKMFYVGCHWGLESDSYVCSSERMRSAYRRRPDDFKRRIVQRVYARELLLTEEHKWLSQIKDEELGKKFYNLNKQHFGHWSANPDARTIAQKISDAPGRREKIAAAHKGKTLTPEHREKLRQAKLGKKQSLELIAKRTIGIRNATKFYSKEAREKIGNTHRGKVLSEEHKEKLSRNHKSKKGTNQRDQEFTVIHHQLCCKTAESRTG